MADGERTLRGGNHEFAAALLGGLASSGVRDLCLCPGSRSTPLAVAAARTPGLRVQAHLDERSAGFFALGVARASRRPVALVCTSGTAAANFLPAVVEAHYARVPLLLLTADRPAELRDWGAGQTIDQIRLYGAHVRRFFEAPTPSAGLDLASHGRMLAARAVAAAWGRPPGPVHLNLPFREPLEPSTGPLSAPPAERHPTVSPSGPAQAPLAGPAEVEAIAAHLAGARRGVLVAGPVDRDPVLAGAVARLARALGWPLLAEPTAQLRSGAFLRGVAVTAHHDAFLRETRFATAHVPDLVLRLGDSPTGKSLRRWLETDLGTRLVLLDPDGVFHDPAQRADLILGFEPAPLCDEVAAALERAGARPLSPFGHALLRADRACARAFEATLGGEPRIFSPAVVRALASALPEGATLYLSNSMAVRDADGFWPVGARALRVLCNRGANGIDGVVSSALGASLRSDGPTVLLTGDLAFLHDVGGLFAARHVEGSCTIVVLHDDGGGIFSFLPIAAHGEAVRFREHFTLPHGLALGPAAALYGLDHRRTDSADALQRALAETVGTRGVHLIEVPLDADGNVAHHRALWRAAAAALSEAGS